MVISRAISSLKKVIITVTLLITPLITTHEPPNRVAKVVQDLYRVWVLRQLGAHQLSAVQD